MMDTTATGDLNATDIGATNTSEPGHNRRCMPPKFRSACMRLGMKADTLHTWEIFHEQSEAAILIFFSALLLETSIYLCLFVGAPTASPYFGLFRVASLVSWLLSLVHVFALWRIGKDDLGVEVLMKPFAIIFEYVGYLGPPKAIPFHSTVKYTAVLGVHAFAMKVSEEWDPLNQSLAPGPSKGMLSKFWTVVVKTLKALAFYTTLSFLQALASQRSNGCWWFGATGRCDAYTALQACTGICIIMDMGVTKILRPKSPNDIEAATDAANCKRVLQMYGVNTVAEFAVIVAALLTLLSTIQNPAASSDRYNEELVAIIMSLPTNLLTLITCIHVAARAWAGLKVLAARADAELAHKPCETALEMDDLGNDEVDNVGDHITLISASGGDTAPDLGNGCVLSTSVAGSGTALDFGIQPIPRKGTSGNGTAVDHGHEIITCTSVSGHGTAVCNKEAPSHCSSFGRGPDIT